MNQRERGLVLFAGSANSQLAQELADKLGISLGKRRISAFPDKEIAIHLEEEVQGKEVVVVQSLARKPNYYLMELLILVRALQEAKAQKIIAVIPYLAYARQDLAGKGETLAAKLVAELLEKAGVSELITIDLHSEEVRSFFSVPIKIVEARSLFVEKMRELSVPDLVVVSPDEGGVVRAQKLAQDLSSDVAYIEKERKEQGRVLVRSFKGDVKGKNVLLVDDICSTGSTLETAAKECKKQGALHIFAVISHMLCTKNIVEIEKIIATNSVELPGKRAIQLSVAGLLADALQEI